MAKPTKLCLCLHEVRCIKTTSELINPDKIKIAAALVGGDGKSHRGKIVDAGKFRRNTVRAFANGRAIAEFPLRARDPWPRTFIAALIVCELDQGQVGRVLTDIVKKTEREAKKALSGVAAAAIGATAGSVAPVIGPLVGAAIGAGVDLAIKELNRARNDDVFPPRKVTLKLREAPVRKGQVAATRKTMRFEGHGGQYALTYSWLAR